MRKHINFEAIDCEDLQYMRASRSWVCLRYYCDLKYCDDCVQCKFSDLRVKENAIRKEKNRG